jgi:hypothetical protein
MIYLSVCVLSLFCPIEAGQSKLSTKTGVKACKLTQPLKTRVSDAHIKSLVH